VAVVVVVLMVVAAVVVAANGLGRRPRRVDPGKEFSRFWRKLSSAFTIILKLELYCATGAGALPVMESACVVLQQVAQGAPQPLRRK
jgi:hypothetical protein